MSVPVLIEAVKPEGFGGGCVVAAAFGDVQVAGVFDGRDDGSPDGGQVGGPAAGSAGGGASLNVRSRTFSGGHPGDRRSDPRVCAAQRLLLMTLPCATGVVQVLASACHRVLGLWLMRVISSRLAARAAVS